MRTQIIKIGNSRGIRIPKFLIDEVGLCSEVELSVQQDHLIIRPTRRPRHDWEEKFCEMAKHNDDRLLDEALPTQWDMSEWTW
ncbi:MAG: AbrB/MazE/SpoVT family DNA-binding domain-containing protein [bacterium]